MPRCARRDSWSCENGCCAVLRRRRRIRTSARRKAPQRGSLPPVSTAASFCASCETYAAYTPTSQPSPTLSSSERPRGRIAVLTRQPHILRLHAEHCGNHDPETGEQCKPSRHRNCRPTVELRGDELYNLKLDFAAGLLQVKHRLITDPTRGQRAGRLDRPLAREYLTRMGAKAGR